jgi:hypothetical protein
MKFSIRQQLGYIASTIGKGVPNTNCMRDRDIDVLTLYRRAEPNDPKNQVLKSLYTKPDKYLSGDFYD